MIEKIFHLIKDSRKFIILAKTSIHRIKSNTLSTALSSNEKILDDYRIKRVSNSQSKKLKVFHYPDI